VSLFALPLVGRAGLGNALFPWARAELFAHETGARILAPHWAQFRLGPYLRGEPQKRNYGGEFQTDHYVCGLSRLIICALGQRIQEGQHFPHSSLSQSSLPKIVEFRGIDDLFAPLLAEHDFIRRQLWAMTTPALRTKGEVYGAPYIAMHVRRGDLTRQGFAEQDLWKVNQYTPLSWFVDMARAVRRISSLRSVPIVIFTDGGSEELAALHNIDSIRFSQGRGPITDLWAMANAGLLFASGFSTFSMWASFLGGMPTVYAPSKIQQRVQTGRASAFEIELDGDDELPQRAQAQLDV